MKILKFGGSSVGDGDRILSVIEILRSKSNEKVRAVVFSAYSGVTDDLIRIAKLAKARDIEYLNVYDSLKQKHISVAEKIVQSANIYYSQLVDSLSADFNELKEILDGVYLLRELSPRSLDYILSFGERLSCKSITMAMNARGMNAEYCDSRSIIKTDDHFNNAKIIKDVTYSRIKEFFSNCDKSQIVTGFISSTMADETTTLGRGGSDFTASILAAALEVDELEIWTDVDGVMTTDPRRVQNSRIIDQLSYAETMELSYFGAKVIYAPTIQPAQEKNIPILIKNTFNPEYKGTVIDATGAKKGNEITGLACIDHLGLIRVEGAGLVGAVGFAGRLFNSLAKEKINVVLISQASSEHSICFAVLQSDAKKAEHFLKNEFEIEIKRGEIEGIFLDQDVSIIAVVGENMRKTPGISGKVFSMLGNRKININAIAQGSSELNISFIIDKSHTDEALRVIHHAFFDRHKVSIYLAGPGNIGQYVLKLLTSGEEMNKNFKIAGVANSKFMNFFPEGLRPDDVQDIRNLLKSELIWDDFIKEIQLDVSQKKVFIDTSDGVQIPEHYEKIVCAGADIVAANKSANTYPQQSYDGLRETLRNHHRQFKYESNVGAALPVIETIKNLKNSGDRIRKIEGIISGSVNYILSKIHNGSTLLESINEAQKLGLTEPDPGIDLSGQDIARKLLILVRELGYKKEMSDVFVESLTDKSSASGYTDIEKRVADASIEDRVVKYVATFEKGNMDVRLKSYSKDHPFYHVNGRNNSILIYSDLYNESPLTITGYGAGIELTASGVLADLMSLIKE